MLFLDLCRYFQIYKKKLGVNVIKIVKNAEVSNNVSLFFEIQVVNFQSFETP